MKIFAELHSSILYRKRLDGAGVVYGRYGLLLSCRFREIEYLHSFIRRAAEQVREVRVVLDCGHRCRVVVEGADNRPGVRRGLAPLIRRLIRVVEHSRGIQDLYGGVVRGGGGVPSVRAESDGAHHLLMLGAEHVFHEQVGASPGDRSSLVGYGLVNQLATTCAIV